MLIGKRQPPTRSGTKSSLLCLGLMLLLTVPGCLLRGHAPGVAYIGGEAILPAGTEVPARQVVRGPSADDRLRPGHAEIDLTGDSGNDHAPLRSREVSADLDAPPAMLDEAARPGDVGAAAAQELPAADDRHSAPSRSELEQLRALAEAARESYARMQNYSCNLTRQERVAGELLPRETVRFQFRKEPWSVYVRWGDDPGRGREIVYVRGRYGDKIHGREPVLFGRIPLTLDPLGKLALSNSRYPITDAGIGNTVEKVVQALAELQQGTLPGWIEYLGPTERPESPHPLECVRHFLPDGTQRDIYFDPQTALPVLIEAVDRAGQLLEYYYYFDIKPNLPELQSPYAFDPNRVFS